MYSNIDWKKVIYIMIIIGFIQMFIGSINLMSLLLTLPGLILGLTVHEFCHAKMADKLGDPTPERDGRLTLNPIAHMDPAGMACLIFAGFGWGKAVRVDPTRFRNPQRDNMLVALAGPLSNFILAFIIFFVYPFANIFLFTRSAVLHSNMIDMLEYAASINLCLFAFNLLPFPPLDGSKILSYFLKGKAREFIWNLERYSLFIIALLFIFKIPSRLITPVVSFCAKLMESVVEGILGPLL